MFGQSHLIWGLSVQAAFPYKHADTEGFTRMLPLRTRGGGETLLS